LTLDDFEDQYCNRNCVSCSASSLATAGLLVFRGFRLRHIGLVQHWIVPILLHGIEINQDNMPMNFLAQDVNFLPVEFWPTGFKKFFVRKRQIWVKAYPSKRIINLLRVVHWLHTW